MPHPDGSVVSMSDSWPGDCEFDILLRQNFFPTYFLLSLLLKHVRKVVGGYGKKFVLVLVWESQETHVCHWLPWYELSCLSGVKPQYNQSTNLLEHWNAYGRVCCDRISPFTIQSQLLMTLWGKGENASNWRFLLSYNVFCSLRKKNQFLNYIHFVVCKCLWPFLK